MRLDAVTQILETVGAIRQGHFELTSGLHSGTYVQCALVLQYPKYAEQLGRALAAEFMDLRVDCVASPALGGVILGHEVARAIPPDAHGKPVRAIFVERDATGQLTLRRGFRVEPDEHILVMHTAVIGLRPRLDLAVLARAERAANLQGALNGMRAVWFEGGFRDTPVYQREKLPLHASFTGPAIIEQLDCTTVIDPGNRVALDALGNLLVTV